MKSYKIYILFLGLNLSAIGQIETSYGTHVDAIQEVLKEGYVDGVFNEGNVGNVQLGFADEFTLFSLTADGKIETVSKQDWINRVKANQAKNYYPATTENFVRIKIVSIDIEDKAAMVKLQFYRGNKLAYIDFIGLYQFREGWKIVSKMYTNK